MSTWRNGTGCLRGAEGEERTATSNDENGGAVTARGSLSGSKDPVIDFEVSIESRRGASTLTFWPCIDSWNGEAARVKHDDDYNKKKVSSMVRGRCQPTKLAYHQ